MIRTFGMILLLCVPVPVTAQTRFSNPTNRNQAKRMGANVEQTLKVKERKWKFKLILESEFGSQHYFKSGKNEIIFSLFVYDSPEEASKQLQLHANGSSRRRFSYQPQRGRAGAAASNSSCAGINVNQANDNNIGSAWTLTTRNKAAMRRIMRLTLISTNGAIAAQITLHRGTLICASRSHCSAASRVAESKSRVRRSSSR